MRTTLIQFFYHYPLLIAGNFFSAITIALLWLISPFIKVKVGALTAQRIGHFALNTDLFFRRRQLYGVPQNTRYIFVAGSVANRQLLTMWKRHMTIIRSRLLRGFIHYSESLWNKTSFYENIEIRGNEYEEYQNTRPTLSFTPEEEERGRRGLKEMGIDPDKNWFVCIFARDAEYMKKVFSPKTFGKKDWSYHDYRNSDINTFKLAIDYLVGRGGFVLRMGYHVEEALKYPHKRMIDYALKYRSDFMDIYLAAKCKFFLGSSAGINDVSMIFDTPRIVTNAAPPILAPNGKNSFFIPKKIRVLATGEYLPYAEFMAQTVEHSNKILWYSEYLHEAGYEYENNTPEELRDVTIEMMERLEGTFRQTEEDKILLANYFSLFPSNHWASCIKTPMGRDFLRKNRELFDPQDTENNLSPLPLRERVRERG